MATFTVTRNNNSPSSLSDSPDVSSDGRSPSGGLKGPRWLGSTPSSGRVTEPRPCPRISHSQPQKNARVQTAPASEQPFGSRFNFLYSAKISAYVCRFFLMSSFIYPPPSTPCSLDFFVWRFLLSTKLLCSPLWCCYPFLANIFVLERISIHGRSCAVEALMHVHGSLLQKKHNIPKNTEHGRTHLGRENTSNQTASSCVRRTLGVVALPDFLTPSPAGRTYVKKQNPFSHPLRRLRPC